MVNKEPIPTWVKSTTMIGGLLLAAAGSMFGLGLCCGIGEVEEFTTPFLMTFPAGVTLFWHGTRALSKKSSRPILLLPVWGFAATFALLILMLTSLDTTYLPFNPLLPNIIFATGMVPSLAAVTWFFDGRVEGITWRRGLVALCSGATGSILLALILESLFPGILLILVFNLADLVDEPVQALLHALSNQDLAAALTSDGFIYALVQIAIIAPLAEELAKPLFVIPILKHVSQRQAFLLGAAAGAGFAMVENAIYANWGSHFAAGILLLRAIGCAIHPLGAGLVALGWRDLLLRQENAAANWIKRFGAAAGMHALWNGGSLLVITLAGAKFFGELSPKIDLLGISAAGTTLAFLLVLGLAALWFGRALAKPAKDAPESGFKLSDRAAAIWALACLVALVPMGITGLQLLLR